MALAYPDRRPPAGQRRFVSHAIETALVEQTAKIKDPEVAWLFHNCFPNTLDTTVDFTRDADGRPQSFVITGDIEAMWLRDSTNQVWPYLPYLRDDRDLRDMVAGLMLRQWHFVQLDPYANAFLRHEDMESEWAGTDQTEMAPGVHERKYELDSLCAVLRLCDGYYSATGDLTYFDAGWLRTIERILKTIVTQQEGTSYHPPYQFIRSGSTVSDNLALGGHGQPARACGLSKSPFRPSDDAAQLPFLVPANAMAVVTLRRVAALLKLVPEGAPIADRTEKLACEIDAGITAQCIVAHRDCGTILAYEVDGFGSFYLMDDANIPSLLSLPYLGYLTAEDPLYQRTRSFILSRHNPYYFAGDAGHGVGGPHCGLGHIWPMSIIMQALTSTAEEEIAACLSQIKRTHGGTGFIHESFWKDDASRFSRAWFAWANTLFGELILHVERTRPGWLARTDF